MREAEWLAGEVFDMSEAAEEAEAREEDGVGMMSVEFSTMDDCRYKARRVLALLPAIRKAFPDAVKGADTYCATCGVHGDHDEAGHADAVADTEARKAHRT